MEYNHEVIMCIVNAGFSEAVMDAAREFGARGGTVIHARGTANPEAEKLFNIYIQPEKEIVMIIVESSLKDNILHALYQKVGLQSEGQGIAFCLPVEDVVGLATDKSVTPMQSETVDNSPAQPNESEPTHAEQKSESDSKIQAPQEQAESESEKEKNFAITRAEIEMDRERLLAKLEALNKSTKND